jgi:hypothetical protein
MSFFYGDSKQEIQLWSIGEDWLSLFKERGEIKGQIFNFMFMHISMNHPSSIQMCYHIVHNWGA